MLGVFAEFETNLRKERQLEGIAKAKAEGIYAKNGGRKTTLDADKVKRFTPRAWVQLRSRNSLRCALLSLSLVGTERRSVIGRASVYRLQ
jgi:DNA invertase Pin-like site-specific DNA recombinase